MNTPHKHAEAIKAWADGAIIQWRYPGEEHWNTCAAGAPFSWYESVEYRVKPELEDPGVVCRNAWYASIYNIRSRDVKSVPAREWTAAAKAVIEAYKAGELKESSDNGKVQNQGNNN